MAVRLLLNALIRDSNDHILVPIPQARRGLGAGVCSAAAGAPLGDLSTGSCALCSGCEVRWSAVAVRFTLRVPAALPQCTPQYPLYSASIQLYGGTLLGYNLKEQTGWSMDFNEISRSVNEAR